MARKIIDIGIVGNDGTGDSIRDSFRKVNDNFRELYGALGLGTKLSILSLEETPDTFAGSGNAVLAVSSAETEVKFKQLVEGAGIRFNFENDEEIEIINTRSSVSDDKNPALGGNLSARFGSVQYRIQNLVTPVTSDEAVNKGYADSKVSLTGVNSIDPTTGLTNSSFGRMTGPLILSRNPQPSDDELYGGLIAATKNYVDNAGFGSIVNLFVATSGRDAREGVGDELQGRALPYAFRTIEAALKRAEELVREARVEIGPYKKVLTFGGANTNPRIISIVDNIITTLEPHGLSQGNIFTPRTDGNGLLAGVPYYAIEIISALEFRVSTTPGGTVLTLTNGAGLAIVGDTDVSSTVNFCTLTSIEQSPNDTGSGFSGTPLLSIAEIRLNNSGINYSEGEFIEIDVPAGTEIIDPATGNPITQNAVIQVLTVLSVPGTSVGPINTFRLITPGVFQVVPGSTNVSTSVRSGSVGSLGTFNITYKVDRVQITNPGSGYGLVSVRVSAAPGDSGTGAFGFARVNPSNGSVESITITDGGEGFTQTPILEVDLPRMAIYTGADIVPGRRTDFTGDVDTNTDAARKGRDIREGLFLRGEESGALAQILAHAGELDTEGNELFDIDIKYGNFITNQYDGSGNLIRLGERIAYGDVANTIQISVQIESGIYEENLPLKVSQNVSIVGDEFRRVIIRPKKGFSTSPWAFTYFKRDTVIDNLSTARTDYNIALNEEFGYHYLSRADEPPYVDPLTGLPPNVRQDYYLATAELIRLNKAFLQDEIFAWVEDLTTRNIYPFAGFEFDAVTRKRDIGFMIDSMIFDLKYGGSDRTVSTTLKFYESAEGLIAISIPGEQIQTVAMVKKLESLIQFVIKNIPVDRVSSNVQTINLAFQAESGSGGIPISLSNISKEAECTVTTSVPHGLSSGEIVSFLNVEGMEEVNGNSFYIEVIGGAGSTSFKIYFDSDFGRALDTRFFNDYVSGTGSIIPNGGVINVLTRTIVNIIENSNAVNLPIDNELCDVFLMNDATILRAVSVQGNGGFAMVLDPAGQILAKSPYAQEGAVFSRSTGRKTFAGGMFVDGFAGNLKFRLLSKIPVVDPVTGFTNSNIRLRIGELQRFPQLPASFIVDDTVYRINYIRDFEYNPAGSTAVLVMDETTPFTLPIFSYNESICSRDVGLILTGLSYDIVFQTNYHTRKSGIAYRQGNASVVIDDQLTLTVRAIDFAHDLADQVLADLEPPSSYLPSRSVVTASKIVIANIIRRGRTAAPSLTMTDPPGLVSAKSNAKAILLANINFFAEETIAYLAHPDSGFNTISYDAIDFRRRVENAVGAIAYDLIYGGNSESRSNGIEFWNGVGDAITFQITESSRLKVKEGFSKLRLLVIDAVQNITPGTTYSSEPQNISLSASDLTTANELGDLLSNNIIAVLNANTGSSTTLVSVPAEVLPNLSAFSYNAARLNSRTSILANVTSIQNSVIDFVDENANVYEILMPGNRSMLSNDFTQINDMGYGLIAANGGLTEAVSMFTYYCQTSYYSVSGGQIRSIGGSSAHGVYALVAEGSDPLEVPTPVDLYYEFSQGATVYNDGAVFNNVASQFILYVSDYEYPPLDKCVIQVDHGGSIGLVDYPISAATTEDGYPIVNDKPLFRLNIASRNDAQTGQQGGLAAVIPNGTRITIRLSTQVVLTGDVVGVATRPSTALKLNEAPENLYRILQFVDYDPDIPREEYQDVTITPGVETLFTTPTPHNLLPGYIIRFSSNYGDSSTISYPVGMFANENYYILDDGFTPTTFKLSENRDGVPLATAAGSNVEAEFRPAALARTTLKDEYNFVEINVFSAPPFANIGPRLFEFAGQLINGRTYTITSLGSTGNESDFTLVGAASNTVGVSFTATGPITEALVGVGGIIGNGTAVLDTALLDEPGFDPATDKVLMTGHPFSDGDVVRFETSGSLPTGVFSTRVYHVINVEANAFQISNLPPNPVGQPPLPFVNAGSGKIAVGEVIGRIGDNTIAIAPKGGDDVVRIINCKFNLKGQNYQVTSYTPPTATEPYGLITITPPLVNNINYFESPADMFGAIPVRTEGSQGTLTIRISLTRCTTHDFLEIGTGSYADTNYPNEIYGPPVRIATETLLDTTGTNDYAQVVERGEGRCFFVTTDQFGNFNVGPFFRVDQGTGDVTFSASIALSNLAGIGFKRGVPIAEFSTDNSFSDDATDTVPTEAATRQFIDRRLGVDWEGNNVDTALQIPNNLGGFLALSGQQRMKGQLDMNGFRIRNVGDPVIATDAVNLANVKISNLQDFDFNTIRASSIFTFTGAGTTAVAAEIVGDIQFNIDSTLNTLDAQINPDTIINSDVNSAAAIAQSKLNLQKADTFVEANPTSGWSGSAPKVQADLGLAKFSNENFETTEGYVRIKDNGIVYAELPNLSPGQVYGRLSTESGVGNSAAITFLNVVNQGGAVKKSQYSTAGGFLRRTAASTDFSSDSDFEMIQSASAYTGATDVNANGRLVIRSSSGDFGGRQVNASVQFNLAGLKHVDTTPLGATGNDINIYTSGVLVSGSRIQIPGITLGDGTGGTDRTNTYRNDDHRFRNYANGDFAPIRVKTVSTEGITGTATPNAITGNWNWSGNLTFQTATPTPWTLDVQNGRLLSRTLTTGDITTTGNITGNWSLIAGSKIDTSAGTLQSTTLTSGSTATAGTITGAWSLASGSTFNTTSGTLFSTTLNAGAAATAGTITGNWTVAGGSALVATSIQSQANSATITAATANTANTIVLRDGSGNFTAGTITANFFSGNGSSLTNVSASSAATATDATNTTNVNVTSTNTNATFYPTFVSATSGNQAINVDSNLTYNASSNLLTVGTLQTTTLTTGSSGTGGSVTGSWSLTAGSRFEATYADLAEYYEGDTEYEVGTVLIFGGEKEVTTSMIKADTRVAGVVSDTAAYTMNLDCQGIKVCLALQGRVPCKVVGKIRKGDILVTAGIKGVAVASADPRVGSVVGKALENYDSDHIGMIQIAVGRT